MPRQDLYSKLVYLRNSKVLGKFAYQILKILGVEIPRPVTIGNNLIIEHGGFGIVIHSKTTIGKNVKIYPGVTIGRANIHIPQDKSRFLGIIIEDDVIMGSGAKVLGKEGVLTIAKGSVIGANAVLLSSTKENEIWAGIPAKCIGKRTENLDSEGKND